MANTLYTYQGTTGADVVNIASMSGGGKPGSGNTYVVHALAGNDTFYASGQSIPNGQYSSSFSSAKFTITSTSVPNGTGAYAGMFVISGASSSGSQFTFVLDSVEQLVFSDRTVTFSYTDTTAPTVSAFSPADAATGVAVNSNIFVTFSEAIQKGSGNIAIHIGSAANPAVETFSVASSTNLTISGNTLKIDPSANLANNTHYFITFDAGSIKDMASTPNSCAGITTYDFTTGTGSDTTAPVLITTTAAAPVAAQSNIDLTFSETIALGTGSIEIHSGSATGALVASSAASTIVASVSGNMLHLDPVNDLAYNTHYVVTLPGSSVNDLAGNSLSSNSVYDFTTEADPYAGSSNNIGVDMGPVVVGVGGLGVLAWALFF